MSYKIDFLGKYDPASIAEELRRIAKITGRTRVTAPDIDKHGRVSFHTVFKKFGSMANANHAAGLVASPVRRWSNDELLDVLISLWNLTSRHKRKRPVMTDVKTYGFQVAADTIARRFGTWNKALLAANERAERKHARRTAKGELRRSSISLRKRFLVLKRGKYQCTICAKKGVELEVDHIIPVAAGGSGELENLQALCIPCNRGKSDILP